VDDALVNLGINARDAMPKGGELTIETANVHLDDVYAAANAEVVPGDYVMLAVSDTGVGMTPDVAEHALEPFFTTKPAGEGTGLGLSMIYGFVRQSGGQVTLKSAPGEGTTVTLFLPRSLAASATPLEELPPAESGHEMILVVEDDSDVRATAVQLIEQLGYSVLEAADGPAGLALVHQHPEIALLFTDVVMPGGMRGDELAAAAKALRPGLKILMSSGNFDLGGEAGSQEKMAYPFIAKPYRAQALASRLRETLGEG
jgi:CheY-like chemotaxis protein